MKWVDLHSHILPGLDDSAQRMDDSLRMAEEALEHGCEMVFATPHAFHVSDIPSRDELAELARAITVKTGLPVATGYEVHILALIEGARAEDLCLEDTNIVLIELPLVNEILAAEDYLSDLVRKGLAPLLAHPERYYYMRPEKLRELLRKGVLTLLNSRSFFGYHGREAKKRAETFLVEGLVSALASDAHGPGDYEAHGKALERMKQKGVSSSLLSPEIKGVKEYEFERRDT